MLVRALTLKAELRDWIAEEEDRLFELLRVSADEWKQVKYLIAIMKPFKDCTVAVGKTTGAIIHLTCGVYGVLNEHLDKYARRLQSKTDVWKGQLIEAIAQAQRKLLQYYRRTSQNETTFQFATMLDPSTKTDMIQVSVAYVADSSSRIIDY